MWEAHSTVSFKWLNDETRGIFKRHLIPTKESQQKGLFVSTGTIKQRPRVLRKSVITFLSKTTKEN